MLRAMAPEPRSDTRAPDCSRRTLFGFPQRPPGNVLVEDISALLFALSTGALTLLQILRPHVEAGITEADEQQTFAMAWPAALAAALIVPAVIKFAERRLLDSSSLFWPLMGVGHTALWLRTVTRLHAIDVAGGPLRGKAITDAFRSTASSHALLTLSLFLGFALLRAWSPAPGSWRARNRPLAGAACLAMASAGIGWIVLQFSQTTFTETSLLAFSAAGAMLVLVTRSRAIDRPRPLPVADLFVLGALVLLLWFPEIVVGARSGPRGADIWVDHYNFYLGPVAAILGGRSPLVDANSQYGVGVVYFIAFVFRLRLFEPSLEGLAHLICLLEVARFFILYLAMRRITRSLPAALLFLCTCLAINVFAPLFVYITLPSCGPLRFIIEYVLVAAIAFQDSTAVSSRRSPSLGILVLVSVGALWSIDTAVTVVGAYLGTRALVALGSPGPRRWRLLAFARDVGLTGVAVGAGLLALAIHVRVTTGVWPIWDRALEYILFYRTWTTWCVPIDQWAMWLPTSLVYLGSAVAIARRADRSVESQAVFAMSLIGIAEMNYYIGRSYAGNLAMVCVPAVFVGCYWFAIVMGRTTGAVRLVVGTAGYTAAMVLLFTGLPGFASKLPFSLLMYTASAKTAAPLVHSPEASNAALLFRKYAPRERRIAVFLNMEVEVEALLMARKTQLWPIAYVQQDTLLPRARDAAAAFKAPLRVGDTLFVGRHIDPIQTEIVGRLKRELTLTVVETTEFGIQVLRVSRLEPTSDN